MSCSPGGPILCFQPENLPGQHPFTRFWKKYSEFSWEAAPPPLSDHITWVKLDSTSCSRVGHPRRLRSSSHCDWLKMCMGLNYCGGDSVLGNSWKKRNFPQRVVERIEKWPGAPGFCLDTVVGDLAREWSQHRGRLSQGTKRQLHEKLFEHLDLPMAEARISFDFCFNEPITPHLCLRQFELFSFTCSKESLE